MEMLLSYDVRYSIVLYFWRPALTIFCISSREINFRIDTVYKNG